MKTSSHIAMTLHRSRKNAQKDDHVNTSATHDANATAPMPATTAPNENAIHWRLASIHATSETTRMPSNFASR